MKRLLALMPLAAVPALGQCVMCFRTAAAQETARAQVLDIGIVLLGVPPFLILAGYCYLFYRKNLVTGGDPLPEPQEQDVTAVASTQR